MQRSGVPPRHLWQTSFRSGGRLEWAALSRCGSRGIWRCGSPVCTQRTQPKAAPAWRLPTALSQRSIEICRSCHTQLGTKRNSPHASPTGPLVREEDGVVSQLEEEFERRVPSARPTPPAYWAFQPTRRRSPPSYNACFDIAARAPVMCVLKLRGGERVVAAVAGHVDRKAISFPLFNFWLP